MSSEQMGAKPDTESSLYAGAIATGLIGLLPYVNVLSCRPTSYSRSGMRGATADTHRLNAM